MNGCNIKLELNMHKRKGGEGKEYGTNVLFTSSKAHANPKIVNYVPYPSLV